MDFTSIEQIMRFLVTVLTPLLAQLSEPLRVEMTHGKTPSDWAESLSHYAWPITVLAILLVYREAISKFLRVIGERATEISFGSWASFKLPVLTESPIDQDVAAFKQIEGTQLSESYKTELFKQFRSADKKEYAIINLGKGREWISSRLFIFAVMLQRMKALKCIVFVSETDQSANRFLGWAPIDSVRWSFARREPWLEAAGCYQKENTRVAFGKRSCKGLVIDIQSIAKDGSRRGLLRA